MDSRVRLALEAIASHWLPRTAWILFAALLLAIAVLGLTQNVYSWIGETPPRGINSIDVWKMGMVIGSAGTATAFLATLFVAQRNYLRDRKNMPHLTMTLSVERVVVSEKYDVLVASLEARNTGSGLCTVKEVNWTVATISPYDDETVNEMIVEFENEVDPSKEEFPWHEIVNRSTQVDLLIEPSEKEQLTQDFVIESKMDATIISAYVANASVPKTTVTGWYRRTLHKHTGKRT